MNKFSAKNKIYVAAAVWLISCGLMFGYFFKILARSNESAVVEILQQKKDLASLQAERDSFERARSDLKMLAGEAYQPEAFFSRDITLVKEIEVLENLGKQLDVKLSLSGLSGTTKTAPKAKTQGAIVIVPYNIILQGSFEKIVDFIETLENLDFITNIGGLSLSAGSGGTVTLNFTSNFYLRQ